MGRVSLFKAYQHLEKSQINKESLATIQSSLFNVSLDDYSVGSDLVNFASKGLLPSFPDFPWIPWKTPIILIKISFIFPSENNFHGQGAHNLWFDKSLSIKISNDGRAGMNGEVNAIL